MNPLFLIVLSIIGCTSVIAALSPQGHVDRVLDTPNMASNGVSNVRNLKQDVTSGQFTELADRTVDKSALEKFVANLRYRLVKLFRNMQLSWARETPEDAFKSLYLHSKNEKLFGSPSFAAWISFTRKKYAGSAGDVILRVLSKHHYTPDVLAPLLVEAVQIPGQRKIAAGIYQDLLSSWSSLESDAVFELLKLDEIKSAEIETNKALLIWFGHGLERYGDRWGDICKTKLANLPHIMMYPEQARGQLASNLAMTLLGRFNKLQLSQ